MPPRSRFSGGRGSYGNKAFAKQRAGQGPMKDSALFVVFQTAGNPGLLRLTKGGPVVFTQYQAEMTRANRSWLDELRQATLDNQRDRFKRPSVSTGRLLKVTADPRNYIFDQTNQTFGFSFGIPRYLNASIAKYWRTIEEGSGRVWKHPFKGTQIAIFDPSFPSTKIRTVTKKSKARIKARGLPKVLVGHEIAPQNAYADAWREHVTSQRFIDVWKTAFSGGVVPSRSLQLFDAPEVRRRSK